jgi:hypothetical protein
MCFDFRFILIMANVQRPQLLVSPNSAAAVSVRIANGQCNIIPTIGQMINANWDSNDLGLAFVSARTVVNGLTNINPPLTPFAQDLGLKWMQVPGNDAFFGIETWSPGLIRVLLWDIWRDILKVKYGNGGWFISSPYRAQIGGPSWNPPTGNAGGVVDNSGTGNAASNVRLQQGYGLLSGDDGLAGITDPGLRPNNDTQPGNGLPQEGQDGSNGQPPEAPSGGTSWPEQYHIE